MVCFDMKLFKNGCLKRKIDILSEDELQKTEFSSAKCLPPSTGRSIFVTKYSLKKSFCSQVSYF